MAGLPFRLTVFVPGFQICLQASVDIDLFERQGVPHQRVVHAACPKPPIAVAFEPDAVRAVVQAPAHAPGQEIAFGYRLSAVASTDDMHPGGKAVNSETWDFFGAEHFFAERAVNAAVKERFLREVQEAEQDIIKQGVDLRGSNPTPDNIRGGLTTIEEKALGAMAKSGNSPLVGVLGYGERPVQPGLHFMNTPAPAVESITGLAAAGCQLGLFSTGVGNPIGHPVMSVVKVSGNRNTLDTFSDNVDFDVSGVLEKDEPIEQAGARLFDYAVGVCSGELTTAEVLDVQESMISRFGLSM